MARNILNDYGDGVAEIYRKKDVEKNVKSLDDLEYLGFLCFTEKSKRQQDIEFAEQHVANLTTKIATPDLIPPDSDYNVVINNVIYAIIYVDHDKKNRELYFYLEEVRKIERQN